MAVTVIDTKGLNCPLPILKLRRAIRDIPAGEVLRLLATDPGAVGDVQSFCKMSGNQLLEWKEDAGVLSFDIRKSG
jgi:tRNA 2-thiouridine synthesizing protein A